MTTSALRDLLDAIIARPGDDDARLVYADALTADGDPRGEFILVQVELAKLGVSARSDIIESDSLGDADVVRAGSLWRRQNELLDAHGLIWIDALFGDIDIYPRVRFRRGFVSSVEVESGNDAFCLTKVFETPAPGIEALRFVRRAVEDDDAIDAVVAAAAASSRLADLREIVISAPAQTKLRGVAVEKLIRACPRLERFVQQYCPFDLAPHLEAACISPALTSLDVRGLTAEMVMRASCMRSLKRLDGVRSLEFLDPSVCPELEDIGLMGWGDATGGFTYLIGDELKHRPPLPKLKKLRFYDRATHYGADAAPKLLDSKIASTLEVIEVDGPGIKQATVEAITASRSITKVDFGSAKIESFATLNARRERSFQKVCIDTLSSVLEAPALETFLERHSSLRILKLGRRAIHPVFEGKMVDVVAAHAPASLRALTLYGWDLTNDDRVRALVRSPSLTNLRSLQLINCAMGDGGARQVSEAPMPNLVEIDLNANGIRGRGVREFLSANDRFRGLASLGLGGSADGDSYKVVSAALGNALFPYKDPYTMASGDPMSSWRDGELAIVLGYGKELRHLTPKEIATCLKDEPTLKDLISEVTLSQSEMEADVKLRIVSDDHNNRGYQEPSPIEGVAPPFTLQIKCASSGGTYTITIRYRLSDRHAIRPALERIAKHVMTTSGEGSVLYDRSLQCAGGGIGRE